MLSLRRAPTWRLHIQSSINLGEALFRITRKWKTAQIDLKRAKVVCISIIFHIPASWLNLLNGYDFVIYEMSRRWFQIRKTLKNRISLQSRRGNNFHRKRRNKRIVAYRKLAIQICPGLNANDIQISYDNHHKVSKLVKRHQKTYNYYVKCKVIWKCQITLPNMKY